MYVVVWSLSKIWTAFFNSSDQTLSNGTCVSRILMRVFETDYGREKGLLLRYTALLLYTQLCCKFTFLSKRKLTYRECCMVNLLS